MPSWQLTEQVAELEVRGVVDRATADRFLRWAAARRVVVEIGPDAVVIRWRVDGGEREARGADLAAAFAVAEHPPIDRIAH